MYDRICNIIINIIKKLKLQKSNIALYIYKILYIYDNHNNTLCNLEELNPNAQSSSINIINEIANTPRYDLQIIVPAYNVDKYIKECLDSIINQKTRYSYQVIIINDGSTDTTLQIINNYISDNVQIINQNNQGLSSARNRGLKFINSRYIMFVDSDDSIQENTIETLLYEAYKSNADIVEGAYNYIYNGKYIKAENCINRTDLYGFPWGKIYRSNLFKNTSFPEKYWYEDTNGVFLIYPSSKKSIILNDLVYNYRINYSGISYSSIGNPKSIDTLYITESLLQDCIKLNTISQLLYETTLRQIQINFIRTYPLGHNVRRAIFIRSYQLLDNVFPNYTTNDPPLKKLEYSLRSRDYALYFYSLLNL